VVLTAPLDSNCIAPDSAVGAQSGANLFLLLRILDLFRETPPTRTILLAAVNAHTQNFQGERLLAWHMLAPGPDVESLRDVMAFDMRVQDLIAQTYGGLKLDGQHEASDRDLLIALRSMTDTSTGKRITLKDPIVSLARRDVNQIKARMVETAALALPEAEETARLEALEAEKQFYVDLLTLFNKVGIMTQLDDLSEAQRQVLVDYVNQIVDENKKSARLNREDLERDNANSAIRNALGSKRVRLVVSLDLSWQNADFGFWPADSWGREAWYATFGQRAAEVDAGLRDPTNGVPLSATYVDALTRVGGMPPGHFFGYKSGAPVVFHGIGRVPAFSLANVHADAGPAFTAGDTFETLPSAHVEALAGTVPVFLQRLLAEPRLTAPAMLPAPRAVPAWSMRLRTFRFDAFSADVVPTLPVPRTAVILHTYGNLMAAPDVIGAHIALTDARAVTDVYGLIKNTRWSPVYSMAFAYDEAFRDVRYALDFGEAQMRVDSNLTPGQSRYLAMFACEEHTFAGRADPSMIGVDSIRVQECIILDAQRNSSPRKYAVAGVGANLSSKMIPTMGGPAAIYVEPGQRFKLRTDTLRVALNADTASNKDLGYGGGDRLPVNLMEAVVRDMAWLNRDRLASMRGVRSPLAASLIKDGDEALQQMREAQERDDHLAELKSMAVALGSHVKAYTRISATRNDMLKAVVFYMALLLPFCFFLQKLLFKAVRIEAQMGIFMLLFVLTYVVFRFVHPAFRVAKAPEAIFIAFVMGILGVFVIWILHGRFESAMQLLFRAHTEAEQAELAYATVGQHAMLAGVNNMKRRRVRTTLTAGTVVLVTFTMLAFTSVSNTLSPTIIPKRGSAAPYTGIFYHWPGKTMDDPTLRAIKTLFAGQADVVVRRWILAPQDDFNGQKLIMPFHVVSSPSEKTAKVEGILGLSVKEVDLLGPLPLTPASRFFSADDAQEVILPVSLANALGISESQLGGQSGTGPHVRFGGNTLTVVGLVPDAAFRARQDIDGAPLLPIKSMEERPENEKAGGAEAQAERTDVTYVKTAALMIIPEKTCSQFGGGAYSVSIQLDEGEDIWTSARRLLQVCDMKFHMAAREAFRVGGPDGRLNNPGVYYIGSGYRTSVGGLGQLIIPILIASTLILNTMLGSVVERKYEISIYNAVGLNPTHIGLFFVSEAFVYGILGAVGGYLIGQSLVLGLAHSGLIADVNLNFSSLTVVYVIFFAIGIVLLSTLYPAMMATRAAVPSGQRKWSMPEHDETGMEIAFPFIYREQLVPGVMAYLQSYFERFTEASVGDMNAALLKQQQGNDETGRRWLALTYDVALAPYDLGVTQHVTLRAAYDEQIEAHRIVMQIQRMSGQDSNWAAVNQPFLEKLRAYLMHWRNLSSAERETYVGYGKDIFH
jgi:hypothetical protein